MFVLSMSRKAPSDLWSLPEQEMESNGLASMINLMMLSAIKNTRAVAADADDANTQTTPGASIPYIQN
jgi:hypothetical protein